MNKQNNNLPLVSIIMPVYNGEKTLRYALASLLCQTYENWICIIVNDGSKDSTKQILDSLTDYRFRIYNLEKNCGRGFARDEALKHAEGKYLAYLDADDIMHKDKLRLQVEYLETHIDVMLCSCNFITISENFNVLRACENDNQISGKVYRYGQALPLSPAIIMVRLDQAAKFHYDHSLDVGEDYDFFARCCDGYKYGNVSEYLYFYMMNKTTVRKLLYYQFNSLNTCKASWKYGLKANAVRLFFKRIIKIIIYLVALPFFGANRLTVNRYGRYFPTQDIMDEYQIELGLIEEKIKKLQ